MFLLRDVLLMSMPGMSGGWMVIVVSLSRAAGETPA
jgi:hypothetical protein